MVFSNPICGGQRVSSNTFRNHIMKLRTQDEVGEIIRGIQKAYEEGIYDWDTLVGFGMMVSADKWYTLSIYPLELQCGVDCGCCAIASEKDSQYNCIGCPVYESDDYFDSCKNTPYWDFYESIEDKLDLSILKDIAKEELDFLAGCFTKYVKDNTDE